MERPLEKIFPRAEQPPEATPGRPVEYATSMVTDGYAIGLVGETLEGRPVKIEGNHEHPASLGATSPYEQASVLGLYDPDRATGVTERGLPRSRDTFARELAREEQLPGLWFLMHPQSSPLVASVVDGIRRRHPGARFVYESPLERRTVYEGARIAFGRPLEAQYDFRRPDVIVSLDADFLAGMPMSVRWSREFADNRRLSHPEGRMCRLYIAEPAPSPTGSLADHAAAAPAGDVPALAAALLAELVRAGVRVPGVGEDVARQVRGHEPAVPHADWVKSAARDLAEHRGRGLVVAGDRQPPETHVLAHLLNGALGNVGHTVAFTEPPLLDPLGATLTDLVEAADAGQVETLVLVESNPVYTAPANLELERVLAKVPQTVHASVDRNETSAAADWFVPLSHYLESWGDGRAYDGTLSLMQPLIRPLYDGYSVPEFLSLFAGEDNPNGHHLLRELYAREGRPEGGDADFEQFWRRILKAGVVPGSEFPRVTPAIAQSPEVGRTVARALQPPVDAGGLELDFARSPSVYDGRFADISWLQELPKPITKLTWDNAALMSPATAEELGVTSGDLVRLALPDRDLVAAAFPVRHHADGAVSLELGYGRRAGGGVARGVGFDAYQLRTTDTLHFARGLQVRPTGDSYRLATTQKHWTMEGRELALHATHDYYKKHPHFTRSHWGESPDMLPDLLEGQPQWAMTIDTTICSGCSACVVACQAENNVPVVGKEGVLHNREMHWLRIDTYFPQVHEEKDPKTHEEMPEDKGELAHAKKAKSEHDENKSEKHENKPHKKEPPKHGMEDARIIHQPMLCQHCEKAPCEYVCPVYATQHSPDGLNEMVYNRCIGTRFCSNNCPYKVRRFNWFDYTGDTPESHRLQFNPNVTVRARGVMEKCTYCVQRIRTAEIDARTEGREIQPNEVVTACQQACPTGAIKFGSLGHEDTDMVEWRRQHRHYAVLHELGTRPRTVYLAKITNPSPVLK